MTPAPQTGAKNVIEVPIGIDGLTLIQAKDQAPLNLTVDQIYKALAANPFGKGATPPRPGRTSTRRFRRPRSASSARRRPRARATAWPS